MTDHADVVRHQTRVSYDYIRAHQKFWSTDAAPQLEEIMKLVRQMELRCRNTMFFKGFMEAHGGVAEFVEKRVSEGHDTFFDLSRTLAEIRAVFEDSEKSNSRIMDLKKTGTVTPVLDDNAVWKSPK